MRPAIVASLCLASLAQLILAVALITPKSCAVAPGAAGAELPASDGERRVLLAERRARGIGELEAYAASGVFPHNHDVGGERVPYLVDRHGRLCAVAYLMASSAVGDGFSHAQFALFNDRSGVWLFGRTNTPAEPTAERYRSVSTLIQDLARLDNHVRIADLKGGPLLRWILTSGFTQAECARIQPAYTYLKCDDCHPGSEERPKCFGRPTAAALELEAADRKRTGRTSPGWSRRCERTPSRA